MICDLFSHNSDVASKSNEGLKEQKHIVSEDDLLVSNDGNSEFKKILLLRFKNCTGNIIDLTDRQDIIDIDKVELAEA